MVVVKVRDHEGLYYGSRQPKLPVTCQFCTLPSVEQNTQNTSSPATIDYEVSGQICGVMSEYTDIMRYPKSP